MTNGHDDVAPNVSPDDRTIAFQSDRNGHGDIWRMIGDGIEQRALSQGDAEHFPEVGPDGKWVFYSS
ncbi:MAG: hypothetical protein WCA98_13765 [Candidatus Acidiferrales bacterium]